MSRKRKILISQPQPSTDHSPYQDLLLNENLEVDFKQFVSVQGVDEKEFRDIQFNFLDYSAVIFTSKIAIDNFFRISKDLRIEMPVDTFYFCLSESFALYLQKYIVYRKRKIFFGNNSFAGLLPKIQKKSTLKFLLPVGETTNNSMLESLDKSKIDYKKIEVYKTVFSDLSDIKINDYDILAFFTPMGIESLYHNFTNFTQNNIKIATFGEENFVCSPRSWFKQLIFLHQHLKLLQ